MLVSRRQREWIAGASAIPDILHPSQFLWLHDIKSFSVSSIGQRRVCHGSEGDPDGWVAGEKGEEQDLIQMAGGAGERQEIQMVASFFAS